MKKNQELASTNGHRVRPAWKRYHDDLLRLKGRLLRERDSNLATAAEQLEPHSLSEADSATDETDHNLSLARVSNDQELLYEIDQALQRIYAGNYGICEATRKPISEARLKAVPWARFSRAAEEKLEKRDNAVPGPRLGKVGTVRKRTRVVFKEPTEVEGEEK